MRKDRDGRRSDSEDSKKNKILNDISENDVGSENKAIAMPEIQVSNGGIGEEDDYMSMSFVNEDEEEKLRRKRAKLMRQQAKIMPAIPPSNVQMSMISGTSTQLSPVPPPPPPFPPSLPQVDSNSSQSLELDVELSNNTMVPANDHNDDVEMEQEKAVKESLGDIPSLSSQPPDSTTNSLVPVAMHEMPKPEIVPVAEGLREGESSTAEDQMRAYEEYQQQCYQWYRQQQQEFYTQRRLQQQQRPTYTPNQSQPVPAYNQMNYQYATYSQTSYSYPAVQQQYTYDQAQSTGSMQPSVIPQGTNANPQIMDPVMRRYYGYDEEQ